MMLRLIECVHNVRCTAHLYYFLSFYLYNVHIKECTLIYIGQTYSTGITKKEFTNVEIQEQTASFAKKSNK